MISMANDQPLNTEALRLKGLSTDPKPIIQWVDSYNQVRKVGNGSTFFEIDTSKRYVYNKQDDEWLLINSGSGSGGGSGENYEYATDQDVIDVVNGVDWGGLTPIQPQPQPDDDDDYTFATDQDILDIVNGADW